MTDREIALLIILISGIVLSAIFEIIKVWKGKGD